MVDDPPHTVTCAVCGVTRLSELASVAPRPPCPECGGTNVSISVSLHEELTFTSSVSATLDPSDQERDWKRRWQEAERRLADLFKPRTDGMSAESIHAARGELHSFYVDCYHLKDYLKNEAATTGVSKQQVEDAITADPALALLADLANLDKHAVLTRRLRSAHTPKIVAASGTSGPGDGWRLNLEIDHGGAKLDGLKVASEALDAWRAHLTTWGLLK